MGKTGTNRVSRRHVFYIPGYDPIHPRRYRELYRREGAAQAAISGYEIAISAKRGNGNYGWYVKGLIDELEVESQVEVLVWSDIVRASMHNSISATYLQLIRTVWIYVSTGALWRLMKLRKGPVIAALYPVGMLLVQLLIALGMGACAIWALKFVLGSVIGAFLAWAIGVGVFIAVLRWFKKRDGRFYAYYLMHDYAYGAQTKGAIPAELDARMAQFGEAIAQALQSDVDEVLVVGHSSGAHLGVTVLADLIRAGRVPPEGPAFGFLSLGQVVPMISFLPDAGRLRCDLAFLSAQGGLTWVDVTAPGDGCAFALCDPVAVTGVAPDGKRWPLVLSAAFTQTLSPERWKELRWRFFRLHFQYLCAFDQPGEYDYFRITAGAISLGDRYETRAPSKSRIENPVNKFTDITT